MSRALRLGLAGLAFALTACTPTLNWRDVSPAGTHLLIEFPCRPVAQTRSVALTAGPVPMTLYACPAAGMTWALVVGEVGRPEQAAAAIAELQGLSQSKMGGGAAVAMPFVLAGASHSPPPQRMALVARRSDAALLSLQAVYFADAGQVFQATVLGPRIPPEAAETFFGSLRLKH